MAASGGTGDVEPPKEPSSSVLPDSCRPKVIKVQKKNHNLCAVCVEIGKVHPTVTYCFDCGRTMCTLCNLNHQQISAFNEHVRITIVEEGSEDQAEEKLRSLICVDHDNMIQKYCWDCSSPVCSVCLIFEHKDHTIKAFAYKPKEEENYDEAKLRGMMETKMSDLQEKMEKIHTLKAQQAHNHRQVQQKIQNHTENVMNQVSAQEHQLNEQLDADHREKQENLTHVQHRVERAKRMVDVLMHRAGAVHKKQSELDRLRALREQVMQLEEPPMGSSKDGSPANSNIPKTFTGEEEAMLDTLMQQAEVVKKKQDEIAKLRGLREQLRQVELKALALEANQPKYQASTGDIDQAKPIDSPNLADPDVIMAMVKNIGDQIAKFKEETERSEMQTSFVPCDTGFSLGSLQLPETTQSTTTERKAAKKQDGDKAKEGSP